MRKNVDGKVIGETAYAIAEQKGLIHLSIREVAGACGVSVGTIYNYFPTKDDLVIQVIETFWQKAFQRGFFLRPSQTRFDLYVSALYDALAVTLAHFRQDWLSQISVLSIRGRAEGKMREAQALCYLRDSLLEVLNTDAQAGLSRCDISASQMVDFVLQNIMASLAEGKPECDVLVTLLHASLYKRKDENSF